MRVVITGANRGIGRALFDFYTAAGETVIGTARKPEPPQIALDVTDPTSVAAMAQAVVQPIDLLICNAGVLLDRNQSLETGYAPELWAKSLATNVTGVFLCVQALLPRLRAARGKIAILSSQMASDARAPGGSYIYRASKAAVLNLGRNLAADLRGEGITVGIYHPGWVQTDMGGSRAELTARQSASGLAARFAALSVATTGCFETHDGTALPF
jgi:NAD(P)-dependent dehydrogenase (short-subunit alcohol dehydrogenase family)